MTVETGPGWELRLGRWDDVLARDVWGVAPRSGACYVEAPALERVDAVITDPPYSERTHAGHDKAVAATRLDGEERRQRVDRRNGSRYSVGANRRRTINYAPWGFRAVYEAVEFLSPRTVGWFVVLTDHESARCWEGRLADAGRVTFAPVPFVAPGSRVRLAGDGPSNWTIPIVPARPRSRAMARWGTLPGAYIQEPGTAERARLIAGAKPLWLMRALVRDYSRPGDLICDPCAGSGTTLLAAALEGRRAIGAEMDPDTFALAVRRLRGEALVKTRDGTAVQQSFLGNLEGGAFDE